MPMRGVVGMPIRLASIIFVGILLPVGFLVAPSARGDDWPCWRGPTHNGTSAETGWRPWDEGALRVAWRAEVGACFSSFVVANGRAFTLGYADGADTVVCLDAASGQK